MRPVGLGGLSVKKSESSAENIEFGGFDPRSEQLGLRIYASASNSESLYAKEDVDEVDAQMHTLLRYVCQIPEGPECKEVIPVRYNFDILGSIDLRKGCFLGQELTARSYYTGIVRKRPYFVIAHPTTYKLDHKVQGVGVKMVDDTITPQVEEALRRSKSFKDSKGKEVLTIFGMSCITESPKRELLSRHVRLSGLPRANFQFGCWC